MIPDSSWPVKLLQSAPPGGSSVGPWPGETTSRTSPVEGGRFTGSMGRVGACADNAAMESFFSFLQKNVLNRQRWQTREQLRLAIVHWIEKTHHRRRRQDRLGRLTPIEFETLLQTPQAA